MKNQVLLFILLLALSCKEPVEMLPDPKQQDISYSLEKAGDDLSKCMLEERDKLVIFSQTSNSFRVSILDVDNPYPIIHSYPRWGQDFNSEGIIEIDFHKYIVYGSMDGYPAWCYIDLSSKADLNIQKITDRKGIFYSGTFSGTKYDFQDFILVGEISNGSDKQNFLMKTSAAGDFLDSLSFGSGKNDGAVDILNSWDTKKIYILSYTYDGPSGDRDVELREYDSKLNLERVVSFGGDSYEQPEKMAESQGSLFVCGHTTSFGDLMHDAYIVRINQDSLRAEYERAIKLDGHEGADDMQVTKDGNLVICSFAQMNPYKGGYYALIHPDGNALYQEKFMEYERFYQLQLFDDRVVFLGQKKNDDLDVAVHMKFF